MIKKTMVFLDNLIYKGILKRFLKTSKLGYGFVVSGAESGTNFEHLYNNRPEGSFFVGKYIDKIMLNLPAVQSTRQRKEDVKLILWNQIENYCSIGQPIRIIDLASGGARYIRELLQENPDYPIEAFCIDKDPRCVTLGKQLIKNENLNPRQIRFIRGDIFKLKTAYRFSERTGWKPNIIIASGLFIYFSDQVVQNVLKEMYQTLTANGCVIFSSYERLDSRKLMRKTMATSSGSPWTLYYRKPEYWRSVLLKIGFKNVLITRDKWKMNNICLAYKK